MNRAEWFKKALLELVGRIDSDWAGDSATRQSVTEISFQCAGRDDVQKKCEADSNQSQFMRGRVLRFQCAGELLGLADLFKELHHNLPVRLEMDSDPARPILQRRGPGGLKHIARRCLAVQQWI